MRKQIIIERVRLEKLVHGGQCLAHVERNTFAIEPDSERARESQTNRIKYTKKCESQGLKPDMADKQVESVDTSQSRPAGRKVFFVWGGLPGELVNVRVTKKKSSYLEAIVTEVIESSPDRITPREPEVYISSSPWQIIDYAIENQAKQAILEETFEREGVVGLTWSKFVSDERMYGYRNKVELGFWGDDDGIHYASYIRGTHGKRIITANALVMDMINNVMPDFLESLRAFTQDKELRAGDLKTVTFRCSQDGQVVASLCMKKDIDCSGFALPGTIKGLAIYYSDPKSPASILTKKLWQAGDITITDVVQGKAVAYDVHSFFQVNLPVFEQTLKVISSQLDAVTTTEKSTIIDMYAGVGAIGLAVGADALVESDDANIAMAHQNVEGTDTRVVHATSETALEQVTSDSIVIVDPPRAGLHKTLIDHLLEDGPRAIIYLSCNPSKQARDVKLLESAYAVVHAQGFNFFPRTPHIESIVCLERKS